MNINVHLLSQGLIEIVLSLLSGILIYFLSFKVFGMVIKNINQKEELKKNNIATSVLVSSFVFGVMLIIRSSISPSMDTLAFTFSAGKISFSILSFAVLRIIIIYLISAVSAFIFLLIAIQFFMILTTTIDELKEIKNNNIAVAVIIAVLTVSLAMIILEPLSTLLKGFIGSSVTGVVNEQMINFRLFYQGLIELGISLIAAIFIFFYGFKVYDFLTKDIDEVKELKSNNIAIAIQVSAFIFSMMILIKASLVPAYDTLSEVMDQAFQVSTLIYTIVMIIIFFILAAVFAFILLWLVMKSFMLLNKNLNEMQEIKNKNIAVAIVIAILLISASLLLQHGLMAFLSGLVPKPEMTKQFLDISFLL